MASERTSELPPGSPLAIFLSYGAVLASQVPDQEIIEGRLWLVSRFFVSPLLVALFSLVPYAEPPAGAPSPVLV